MSKFKKLLLVVVVVLIAALLYKNFRPVNIAQHYNYQVTDASQIDSPKFDEAYAEFEAGDYTVESPYIAQNINSGLNAYIMFNDDANNVYGYTVHGKEGTENTDFTYIQDANSKDGVVVLPVIGLYADFDNIVDIIDTEGNVVNTLTITTKAVERAPIIDVLNNEESVTDEYFENGFLMTSNGQMYDQYGELRGLAPATFTPEYDVFAVDNDGQINMKDIMGRNLQIYDLPLYNGTQYESELHHDFSYDSEGNLYILTGGDEAGVYGGAPSATADAKEIVSTRHAEDPNYTIEAAIYKYDSEGNLVWEKTYDEYFDENLVQSVSASARYDVDPVHFNSIEYNNVNGYEFLLVSARSQDGFMAIDPETGDIMWKFGSKDQVREEYDMYLDYDPETTPVPSGQHSARLLQGEMFEDYYRDGKLVISVFNNNFCKGNQYLNYYTYITNMPAAGTNYREPFCTLNYSAQEIYAVDPKAGTVEYIKEIPYSYDYSAFISNVFQIDEDMFYTHTGIGQSMIIMDYDGNEYFHADVTNPFPIYRSFLLQEESLYDMLDLASVIE